VDDTDKHDRQQRYMTYAIHRIFWEQAV
jgi:hypothetical protein